MRLHNIFIALITSLALIACGGMKPGGNKGPSAYEQLSGVSGDLQTKLDETSAPINNTDAFITRFTELPTTLKLSTEDYKDFVIGALRGEMKLPEGASAEVTQELTAFSTELKSYNDSLTATPDNAQALIGEIASALVKVPTLATQIEGEAQIVKANPLATKEEKKKADEQSSGAKALADETTSKIQAIQTEAQGLPAKAASALGKFAEALKSVGIDNLDTLKTSGSDTAKGAVEDAKEAGEKVVETAKESAEGAVEAAQ